jgi:hypothetical protein
MTEISTHPKSTMVRAPGMDGASTLAGLMNRALGNHVGTYRSAEDVPVTADMAKALGIPTSTERAAAAKKK